MNTNIHLCSCFAQLLLDGEMFQTKFIENIKTHTVGYVQYFFLF